MADCLVVLRAGKKAVLMAVSRADWKVDLKAERMVGKLDTQTAACWVGNSAALRVGRKAESSVE